MSEARTFIVAEFYEHFRRWCRENNVRPTDRSVVFVSRPQAIQGWIIGPQDRVIHVGPAWRDFDAWDAVNRQLTIARLPSKETGE